MPSDYQRVAAAIRYLEDHRAQQPDLEAVAAHVGLSPHHFQRLFTRWAGVSPKRFLQHLTAEHARGLLQASASALEAAHAVGLSGAGRLHDLMTAVTAATPGEIKTGGAGLRVRYGRADTPFGPCLIGATDRGICHLSFLEEDDVTAALAELRRDWPAADLAESPAEARSLADRVFGDADQDLPRLLLKGTNFQLQVWTALLRTRPGQVTSYGALAAAVGKPRAAQAVGQAVGSNRLAYLIPCHRVLRETGALGGYRWGEVRKQAMLGREWARAGAAG